MENILLTQIPIDQFKSFIKESIKEEVKPLLDQLLKEQNENVETKVKLIKIDQVVDILKLSKQSIYKHIRAKRLPAYHIGKRLYFKENEVYSALNSSK